MTASATRVSLLEMEGLSYGTFIPKVAIYVGIMPFVIDMRCKV